MKIEDKTLTCVAGWKRSKKMKERFICFSFFECGAKPVFDFEVFLLTCSEVSYTAQPFQMSALSYRTQ